MLCGLDEDFSPRARSVSDLFVEEALSAAAEHEAPIPEEDAAEDEKANVEEATTAAVSSTNEHRGHDGPPPPVQFDEPHEEDIAVLRCAHLGPLLHATLHDLSP